MRKSWKAFRRKRTRQRRKLGRPKFKLLEESVRSSGRGLETSYELFSYSSLVVYSVLAGSVSCKRVDFKSKVVDAPEIKAILGDGDDKLSALSGALSAGPGADAEMKDASAAAPSHAKAAVNL